MNGRTVKQALLLVLLAAVPITASGPVDEPGWYTHPPLPSFTEPVCVEPVKDEETHRALRILARKGNKRMRVQALEGLALIGDPHDASMAVEAIDDPSSCVRTAARELMERFGRTVPPREESDGGEGAALRRMAAIAEDSSSTNGKKAAEMFSDQALDPSVRAMALTAALGHGGTRLLVRGLRDDSPIVRYAASRAAADYMQRRKVWTTVRDMLHRERNVSVLRALITSVGDAAFSPARGDLLPFLEHPSTTVREAAVRALSCMLDGESAEAVAKRLSDEEVEVRESAVAALSRPLPAAVAAAAAMLSAGHPVRTRRLAAYALAKGAAPEAFAHLKKAAADPDRTVRLYAAWGIGRIRPSPAGAREVLRRMLADREPAVRAEAAIATGRALKRKEVEELLGKVMKDADPVVRAAAIAAAVEAKTGAFKHEILTALRDYAAPSLLRYEAAKACTLFRWREAIPDLKKLLFEKVITVKGGGIVFRVYDAVYVRIAAMEALYRMNVPGLAGEILKKTGEESFITSTEMARRTARILTRLTGIEYTWRKPSPGYVTYDVTSILPAPTAPTARPMVYRRNN